MLEIEQMVSPALLTDKKRSLVDWSPVKAIIKKKCENPQARKKNGAYSRRGARATKRHFLGTSLSL